jgi:hypothetical protein
MVCIAPDVNQCTDLCYLLHGSAVFKAAVRGEIHPSCLTFIQTAFVVSNHARACERGWAAVSRQGSSTDLTPIYIHLDIQQFQRHFILYVVVHGHFWQVTDRSTRAAYRFRVQVQLLHRDWQTRACFCTF